MRPNALDFQGESLILAGQFKEAEVTFRSELARNPNSVPAKVGLANAFLGLGRLEEAIQACREALDIQPKFIRGLGTLGVIYQRQGNFTEAIRVALQAIDIDPTLFKPYVEIARCKRITTDDDPLLADLERLLSETNRPKAEQFYLNWALGKACDDLGQFEKAMIHFESANLIAKELTPGLLGYDPAARAREVQYIKGRFLADTFGEQRERSAPPTPVFIVGMIRSGTTLLDSLVCRHADISSAGELRFWEKEAAQIFRQQSGHSFSEESLSSIKKRYLDVLCSKGENKWVIDKMPNNFRHLGLIKLAFPYAKIIHLTRHPVDTCLSIYTTDFGPRPPQFAFDRYHIVTAYKLYRELMGHWLDVLPKESVLEISYEDLVMEPDLALKKVMAYLDAPWQDGLLDKEQGNQDIITPSRWQARQPIYRSSLQRWKNYRPWLGNFVELLPAEES
jgi:tetratricopeptide (TPR) repeat protein